MKFNWTQVIFCVGSFLVFLLCFEAAKNQFAKGYGDNAFLMELLDNIADTGRTDSMVARSTSIAYRTWTMQAKDICAKAFELPTEPMNYFRSVHPYFILYLVAPLKSIFTSSDLLAFLMTLSFLGIALFFVYKLFKADLPFLVILLLMHMLMSHPAWAGVIMGQAYVDRVFVFLGGLLFWRVFDVSSPLNFWYYILLLLVLTINERTGILAGLVIGFYGLLSWRSSKNAKVFVASAIAIGIFSFYLTLFYVKGYDSTSGAVSGIVSLDAILRNAFNLKSLTLWVYSAIILGPWSFSQLKMLFAGFVSLAPNTLVSVGGAEKTGWVTHYASGYLPALLVVSVVSFLRSYTSASLIKKRFYVVYIVFSTILFMSLPTDFSGKLDFKFSAERSVFYQVYSMARQRPIIEQSVRDEIKKIIHPGASVSSSEFNFKFLWNYARPFYYPAGIDSADYILLSKDSALEFPNAGATFLGNENLAELNRCLWERMQRTHPNRVDLLNAPFVILKR